MSRLQKILSAVLFVAFCGALKADSFAWERFNAAARWCAKTGDWDQAEYWYKKATLVAKASHAPQLELDLSRYGLAKVAMARHRYSKA